MFQENRLIFATGISLSQAQTHLAGLLSRRSRTIGSTFACASPAEL
jgi:hypothetical protein